MTKQLLVLMGILLWGVVGTAAAQTPTAVAPTPTSTPLPWSPDPNAIFADGVKWEAVPPTPEPPTETPVVYPTYDPEPPQACGGVTSRDALEEGPWVIAYQDKSDGQEYLCNIETGEERHTLPPNERDDDWSVYTTPDPTKLLLGLRFEFFVYNLNNDHYIDLGIAAGVYSTMNGFKLCRWMTSTQGLLCTYEKEFSTAPVEYFSFDITQPDSITLAFEGWDYVTFYEDDLNRYVSMYGDMYVWRFAHKPCHVTVYDAQGLREKELGYDCVLIFDELTSLPFYRHGDYLYYIVVDEDKTKPTSLYRYSIVDETITEIRHDFEVKNIIGVSPDEQYIVVLTDTDLERTNMSRGAACCVLSINTWQVAILAIETGDVVYKTDELDSLGVYTPDQLIWVDDTTLLLKALLLLKDGGPSGSGAIWRIELPKQGAQEKTVKIKTMAGFLYDPLPLSPNAIYGFAENGELVDLRTLKPVPLFRDDPDYDLKRKWESDHALLVTVLPRHKEQTSITYRVILP